MPETRLPDTSWFLDRELPEYSGYRVVRKLDAGLCGAVFVAHSKELARDVACKIVRKDTLQGVDNDPPSWMAEVTKANQIRSSKVVQIFHVGTWNTPDCDCVYFLADLVPGQSLRAYMKSARKIDFSFILTLVEELLDFLHELRHRSLQHGDLHPGNILVEDRSGALTGPPYAFRITDFGVAPITTGGALLDDYEQLARIVRELLEQVDYVELLPLDRSIFDYLRNDLLGKRLLEQDTAFEPSARDPRALFDSLREARDAARHATSSVVRELDSPFDYLSCEQIGEAHALLKELYSDKMLGLHDIEERNNLVLTGPRGCGKTTVFRCLSLKHLVRTQDDALSDVRYIGVYYRCDDLYYAFPRYRTPSRAEAIDVPVHYITVTLLRELLEALALWLPIRAGQSWGHREGPASEELWRKLRLKKPQSPSAHTFAALIRALERERLRAASKQRFVDDPQQSFGEYFGPEVLLEACALLRGHFEELAERPVFFFIDDYSAPKISEALQRSLNRLVMQRNPSCFFKLATESPASYISSDIDDKAYVEGREFRLVNLGMDFIHARVGEKLRFLDDVFNRRFGYARSFPVKTIDTLVGDGTSADYNETARQIRGRRLPSVWGRNALGELCSGDIHFIIDLVGKMVSAAGGGDSLAAESAPVIPATLQHKVIREEAGNFLKNLRALPNGPQLVEVVEAFGRVAASYLRHRDSKNEESNPPHQASRIEPYENPELSGKAHAVYRDLLRYSVFLEDVRGKSRRGVVVPRLYLRRFLIPFFNLTFSKRDSLSLTVEEFVELLLNPKQFESQKRLRGPEELSPAPDENQLSLPLDGEEFGGEDGLEE